jgi:hypothetical protein
MEDHRTEVGSRHAEWRYDVKIENAATGQKRRLTPRPPIDVVLSRFALVNGAVVYKHHFPYSRKSAGAIAGAGRPGGYMQITCDGCRVFAHHVAWVLTYGKWPESDLDHIDRNPSNNSPSNLRLATRRINSGNSSRNAGVGKLAGVHRHKSGKWLTRIGIDNQRFNLGLYENYDRAVAVKTKAELMLGLLHGMTKDEISQVFAAEFGLRVLSKGRGQ